MKAVFVFCEGNHDVIFVARSLGQVAGAVWVGVPIEQLPSPLGPVADPSNPRKPKVESVIVRRYSARTLGPLQLQAAGHAPLPAFEAVLRNNDTVYVLVRCNGDDGAQAAIDLLADVTALLNPAFGTDVTQLAAVFLFDADASVSGREAGFAADYAALLGPSLPTHATWTKMNGAPIGLYIFHESASQAGTLEDLLAPMVTQEWPTRWSAASTYLTSHADANDPVSKKPAKHLKAQINITGQFLLPGDPMSQVIGRRGLPDVHFQGVESLALVTFLQGVPW